MRVFFVARKNPRPHRFFEVAVKIDLQFYSLYFTIYVRWWHIKKKTRPNEKYKIKFEGNISLEWLKAQRKLYIISSVI